MEERITTHCGWDRRRVGKREIDDWGDRSGLKIIFMYRMTDSELAKLDINTGQGRGENRNRKTQKNEQ